jgi:hypothetical protein
MHPIGGTAALPVTPRERNGRTDHAIGGPFATRNRFDRLTLTVIKCSQ